VHQSWLRRITVVLTRVGTVLSRGLLRSPVGYQSADRILMEIQPPKIGDWMPMAEKVNDTTAFKVAAFESNEWLLWQKPDSTWAWKLTAWTVAERAAIESDAEAQSIVEHAAKELHDAGVKAHYEVRTTIYGQAGLEIVDAARSHDAGVIVMGSRGHSDLAGLVLGSTAQGDPLLRPARPRACFLDHGRGRVARS
jgi:nucleotide-binding universal stress UspA family protein